MEVDQGQGHHRVGAGGVERQPRTFPGGDRTQNSGRAISSGIKLLFKIDKDF